jgi:16S rRNA (adenine1518-N6/adenine1519-N6)-dimethyltransferase
MNRDPQSLLKRAKTKGNQKLDQYFITDECILERIQEYAHKFDRGHVLEIGPGIGNLTHKIIEISKQVTAVEIDPHLVNFLTNEFKYEIESKKLKLIQGDFMKIKVPICDSSISNLPYEKSSQILFNLLPRKIPLILMVQKEFAQRLVAHPDTSEYGRLSITSNHYAEIEVLEYVPPTAFNVHPEVESAIIRSVPHEPDYEIMAEDLFFALVTAAFTQRRKKMSNAIKNTTHITKFKHSHKIIHSAEKWVMDSRPGELTPQNFADLANIAFEIERAEKQ